LQKEADELRAEAKTVLALKVKAEQERLTEIKERTLANEERDKAKKELS